MLDGNCTRMLRAILNKFCKQHPTKCRCMATYLPSKHAGHCRRSKDELVSDVLLWTLLHGRASVWRQTRTYLQRLCTNTGCSCEGLTEEMDDRDEWQERFSTSLWYILYLFWWGWGEVLLHLSKIVSLQS